eukprot:scaffold13590_cov122-Skeletonema_dohrnii-CCMP3373.AAC.1
MKISFAATLLSHYLLYTSHGMCTLINESSRSPPDNPRRPSQSLSTLAQSHYLTFNCELRS